VAVSILWLAGSCIKRLLSLRYLEAPSVSSHCVHSFWLNSNSHQPNARRSNGHKLRFLLDEIPATTRLFLVGWDNLLYKRLPSPELVMVSYEYHQLWWHGHKSQILHDEQSRQVVMVCLLQNKDRRTRVECRNPSSRA
jgi:hypothetical protein